VVSFLLALPPKSYTHPAPSHACYMPCPPHSYNKISNSKITYLQSCLLIDPKQLNRRIACSPNRAITSLIRSSMNEVSLQPLRDAYLVGPNTASQKPTGPHPILGHFRLLHNYTTDFLNLTAESRNGGAGADVNC
jgi:hypothetical protein